MIKEVKTGQLEIKNTFKLQLTSLSIFAAVLGYVLDTTTGVFVNASDENLGMIFVKIPLMQKWHNSNFEQGTAPDYSDEQKSLAIAAKLVEKTKFKITKEGIPTLDDHQIAIAEF